MTSANWRGTAPLCGLFVAFVLAYGQATPPLTTIEDTLYRADGKPYTGYLQIEWKSFEASDSSTIATQSLNLRIYNGRFKTQLVPTTTALGEAHYRVRYVSDGRLQTTETWEVPSSGTPLRVKDVRVANPTGGGAGLEGQIEISDVNGLEAELELRPRKGPAYTTGRAAIISSLGELEGALGGDSDCVHVDGLSGTCGAAGGEPGPAFVDPETPSGAVDGMNDVFTLSQTPSPSGSLLAYRNGLLQKLSLDYDFAGSTITFLPAAIPQTGDILLASYRLGGSGVVGPVLLCGGPGTATNSTTPVSLGGCTIPASTIQTGDRIELRFDYEHQGTTTGFSIDVAWGGDVLVARTANAGEPNLAGGLSLGVHGAGTSWQSQTWGSALALATGAGSSSPTYSAPLVVVLRGAMGGTTMETIALRNFTVIRYPAP